MPAGQSNQTLIAAAQATLAGVSGRHERVFLTFSGGKDSLTVLRLHSEAAAGIRARARFALSLAAAKANEMIGVLDGTGLAAREVSR
jgi:PP-loop superfamily ATP-utilizing enzyme